MSANASAQPARRRVTESCYTNDGRKMTRVITETMHKDGRGATRTVTESIKPISTPTFKRRAQGKQQYRQQSHISTNANASDLLYDSLWNSMTALEGKRQDQLDDIYNRDYSDMSLDAKNELVLKLTDEIAHYRTVLKAMQAEKEKAEVMSHADRAALAIKLTGELVQQEQERRAATAGATGKRAIKWRKQDHDQEDQYDQDDSDAAREQRDMNLAIMLSMQDVGTRPLVPLDLAVPPRNRHRAIDYGCDNTEEYDPEDEEDTAGTASTAGAAAAVAHGYASSVGTVSSAASSPRIIHHSSSVFKDDECRICFDVIKGDGVVCGNDDCTAFMHRDCWNEWIRRSMERDEYGRQCGDGRCPMCRVQFKM